MKEYFKYFSITYQLRNTYRTNGFVSNLMSLPWIGSLIPDTIFSKDWLKIIVLFYGFMFEVISTFLGKLLYVFIILFLPLRSMDMGVNRIYLYFLALCICGAIFNTNLFNPTKDKYYAIILLRMQAKKVALSNYCYFLMKEWIGFFVCCLGLCFFLQLSLWDALIMASFVVSIKTCVAAISLSVSHKHFDLLNENKLHKGRVMLAVTALVVAVLALFGVVVVSRVWFYCLFVITFFAGIAAWRYLLAYSNYQYVYKRLLQPEAIVFNLKSKVAEQNKKTYENMLDESAHTNINLQGYAYFHTLFVRRHRKIMLRSIQTISLLLAIAVLVLIVVVVLFPIFHEPLNAYITTTLPSFVLIMYYINRGQQVTQAMFINCDQSMLQYRFFKQPKAILQLFVLRLKTMVLLNAIPASILAFGFVVLLFLTGGSTNPLDYLWIALSILFLSIFFSVHHLCMYYLFQPYKQNLEIKSLVFQIISAITYILCFFFFGMEIEPVLFAVVSLCFTILYITIALLLTARLATRTFRLKY
ncbi:MAG: hypothetical protein ACRDCA_03480 [Serratia sp. (in: enterobacteria)]|uniref:hypothetical protein n=1 Tax=Serratia sp. (in: enterobacteria) TaxID=616 RepID=UPI003F2AA693